MSGQVFADETKHRDYLMVAAVLLPPDVAPLRRVVRGQRRLRMSKESAPRRRVIAETIAGSGVSAVPFDAEPVDGDELGLRRACLRGVVAHVDDVGADRLVLGRDDSVLRWGPAVVGGDHPGAGLPGHRALRVRARAAEGLLLSVPDATAWWWGRGGDWRRRIRPAVTTVELV